MLVEEHSSAGIDVTEAKDGGVIKVIKKEGCGNETPSEGATVYVQYVGTLLNGEKFDSSKDAGRPFDFVLGRGYVIKGWELGLPTMKKGEVCSLTCQPEYAYGKKGRPPTIPEDAILVFEIELLYWVNEKVTMDELVSKKILKKGKGKERVGDGGIVDVHLIGKDGDRVFDERDVQFTIGEGDESDVILGVDEAVKTMKKGEISFITADSSYAFGDEGRPEWNIAPGATVEYEVHLKSFEPSKAPWELSSEERIDGAKVAKAKGTEYFKQGKYSLALSKFSRLVALVENLIDAELDQVAPMILAGHLNVAACYLKLGEYKECINACDKALDRDKNNIKALYRKARAQLSLHYLDEAKELFQRVLKLDPKNKDARTYYLVVKKKLEEHKQKERKIFANMFDKFASRDSINATHSQNKVRKDEKDVFARAEEEAKTIFGDEARMEPEDVKVKDPETGMKTSGDVNTTDSDDGKTKVLEDGAVSSYGNISDENSTPETSTPETSRGSEGTTTNGIREDEVTSSESETKSSEHETAKHSEQS